MSLHADAVTVLDGWRAPDDGQERLRREYLNHLAVNGDGMWRSCAPSHLTASTVVLDRERRQVLLVLHARLGLWLQPGGHCESGDGTLLDVARREAVEETGIAALELIERPARLLRTGAPCDTPARWHLDVQYVALADRDALPTVSTESHDVRWFAIDRLPDGLARGVAESVQSATQAAAPGAVS